MDYISNNAKAIFALAVFIGLGASELCQAMTLFHQRNPPFRDLDLPIETKSWIDLDNELIRCYQRLIQGLEEVEIEERMEDLQSKAMTSVDHILISIEGPVLSEEDRVWSFQRISEFQDNQKSFCTPVFDGSEADHDLFGMTVPFVEKYKTYGEGSFGIVSKYRIHRDHIIPGNLAVSFVYLGVQKEGF